MRWLFADPNQAEEAAAVREKVAAIDRWWEAFETKRPQVENRVNSKSTWNLPKFMEEALQAIDPRLMWEYGPAVKQEGHRLVITPESQRFLRPMVRTILERAPKIAGWEFYPYRLAETAEQAIQTVKGRAGVDISSAVIDASVAPGRKIDLNFAFPLVPEMEEEAALQAAFAATEALLGEQILDTWIGQIGLIEGEASAGSGSHPLPLDRAQAAVATVIRGIHDLLPGARAQNIAVGDGWATVKLDPPEVAEDYAGRGDLVVATARDMELFQAMHDGQPFSSACHSKLREQFCYLKVDAADVGTDNIAELRSHLEEALNPALVAADLGGCIGGGSGLRYAYIDLALTDVKKAAPVIRHVLAERQSPQRSWLLFHDDDLAAEWIGIYAQTPAPPEEVEE